MIAQKRGDEEPKTRRRGTYEKAAFRKNRKKGVWPDGRCTGLTETNKR